MREELDTLVRELRLEEAVKFVGFLGQSDLNRLYASAHIFLHPSEMTEDKNQEGIPNSMLEAMSTGLPVLATLHGGIPEAVEQGRTGILVPERAPGALAAALFKMTRSWETLTAMGEQAYESVQAEFDQTKSVAKLESFYDEVLKRTR